jgi:hypothetical protein
MGAIFNVSSIAGYPGIPNKTSTTPAVKEDSRCVFEPCIIVSDVCFKFENLTRYNLNSHDLLDGTVCTASLGGECMQFAGLDRPNTEPEGLTGSALKALMQCVLTSAKKVVTASFPSSKSWWCRLSSC